MRGGRRKLPVLAEISGPAAGEARAWSLRREPTSRRFGKLRGRAGRPPRSCWSPARRGRWPVAIALAGAASRRRPPHGAARVRPGPAAAGRRPRPGAGARAARVPALGGDARPRSCSRWSSPARRRRRRSEPLVCVVAGRPAPDAGDPARARELPPRDRQAARRLRAASSWSGRRSASRAGGLPAVAAAQADAAARRGRAGRGLRAEPGASCGRPLRRLPAAAARRRSSSARSWQRSRGRSGRGRRRAARCPRRSGRRPAAAPSPPGASPARRQRSTPKASAITAMTKATIGTR